MSKDKNYKLKPCPFCGGEARCLETNWRDGYNVFCEECGVITLRYSTPDDAIKEWNKRVSDDSLEVKNEKLKKKINDQKAHIGRQATRIKILEEDKERLREAYRKEKERLVIELRGLGGSGADAVQEPEKEDDRLVAAQKAG